jgi:hypothetical protein
MAKTFFGLQENGDEDIFWFAKSIKMAKTFFLVFHHLVRRSGNRNKNKEQQVRQMRMQVPSALLKGWQREER